MKYILTLLAVAFFSFFIVWLGINLILGCETWDREMWTEQNSCYVPWDKTLDFLTKEKDNKFS